MEFDLSLELYTRLPSQRIRRGEAEFEAVQQDLGNVGKVATQERKDALQLCDILQNQQVEGDPEARTPILIVVNKRILFHLRNCKRFNLNADLMSSNA